MLHCAAVQGFWPRLRSNRAGLALTNVRAGARSDVSFTISRLQSTAIVSGTYAVGGHDYDRGNNVQEAIDEAGHKNFTSQVEHQSVCGDRRISMTVGGGTLRIIGTSLPAGVAPLERSMRAMENRICVTGRPVRESPPQAASRLLNGGHAGAQTVPMPGKVNALLRVRGLTRGFYGVQALAGLDFDVMPGTITALIGPNGAGKTTAFQCISGVVPPYGGTVTFDGYDITGWRPDRITRAGLVRTFQVARGIPRMTVLENLLLYAPHQPGESIGAALTGLGRMHESDALNRALDIAHRLNLLQVADNPASNLSGGQKKLLEIGRALMAAPRMVMLDEPIAGVNPSLIEEIALHIRELRDEGITFLVIEHHMDLIARLCDPVIVMAEGRRLTEGRFADIAADRAVQEAYMGRRR